MIERDKQNKLRTHAFKRIWKSDDGKVLDEFLKQKCNVNRSTICQQSPNALQTACEEGKRIVYLDIMWYINEGYLREDENG